MKKVKINISIIAVIISIVVLVGSTYIHSPDTHLENFGFKYTDIVYGSFYKVFDVNFLNNSVELARVWYRSDVFKRLINGEKLCPIPYIDHKFEYPLLIGGVWYATTCTTIFLTLPNKYDANTFISYLNRLAQTYYLMNVLIIVAFFVTFIIFFIKLAKSLNVTDGKIMLLPLILPSTFLYIIYSWDVLTMSLTFIAIYLYVKGFYNLDKNCLLISSALFGLSILSNILIMAVMIIILYELVQLIQKGKFCLRIFALFVLVLVAIVAIPYATIYVIGHENLQDILIHYLSYNYCENCLYLIIDPNIFSPLHKVLYIVLFTITIFAILAIELKNVWLFIHTIFLTLTSALLFNYVFKPQIWLLITPLAILVFAHRKKSLILYSIADLCNFSIMAAFFKDLELRMYLSKYIPITVVEQNPLSIHSPVQWFAFLRNLILLLIFLNSLYHVYEFNKDFPSNY